MKLEWLGRYRELVRALVYYSNSSNKCVIASKRSGEFNLTQHEYQILEYLCEFEDENRIMADISQDLGIGQSSVTKAAKRLIQNGMVERFRLGSNQKNIVLKPTEKGKAAYGFTSSNVSYAFIRFFQSLDSCTDEQLKVFENAVWLLSNDWNHFPGVDGAEEEQLTKLE